MFACFSGLIRIIILIQYFLGTSFAQPITTALCDHSACGNIRNISNPFRLRGDPPHCGDSRCELVCENDTTLMYFGSQKLRVQSIDYNNYTIRVSDPSLTNDTCSFPHFQYDFYSPYYISMLPAFTTRDVTLLSCEYPVNYSFYTKVPEHCLARNKYTSSYVYMKYGGLNASDVGHMCTIELVVNTAMQLKDDNNISLLEIHRALLYGFELSWFSALCGRNCEPWRCGWDGNRATCNNPTYPFRECNLGLCINIKQGPSGVTGFLFRVIFLKMLRILINSPVQVMGIFGTILVAKHVIGVPIFLGLLINKLRTRHLSMFDTIESFLQNHNNLAPIRYSYSHVKKMTRGFREKLGQGGYGTVYKGKLRSGRDVAVKVLMCTKSRSNGQDFMNEVATIGRIHHTNVVRLVGYCAERSKRALIYDFMPNGSLDKYICRQETTDLLSWENKYEIAVGVGRGIDYLHRGCDIQILHFDIKPHNILLDHNFTPKISDFGLAKFYSTEKNTVTLTAARGTVGYVAPELINRSIGGVSYKADVYSFGMLLMEMVGLNRDLVQDGDESSQYFPFWIYNHLDKWKDIEAGNDYEIDDVDGKITRKMTIVALWCIKMSPGDRPTMSEVLEMLESEVESLQIPPQPSHSQPHVVAFDWETDTTDSRALPSEDNSMQQHL